MPPWEVGNPVWTTWCMNQRCGIPSRLNGVSTRLVKSCLSLMTLLKGLRNYISDGWCLRKNCGIMFHGNGVSKKNAESCFWSMVPPTKNAESCFFAFSKTSKTHGFFCTFRFSFCGILFLDRWGRPKNCGILFLINGAPQKIAESCFCSMVPRKKMRNSVSDQWCLHGSRGILFLVNGAWETLS